MAQIQRKTAQHQALVKMGLDLHTAMLEFLKGIGSGAKDASR
jgi:hypothetical protein